MCMGGCGGNKTSGNSGSPSASKSGKASSKIIEPLFAGAGGGVKAYGKPRITFSGRNR